MDKNKGINIKESRSISKQFIPTDSKLIKTYKSQSNSIVDLYMSESLKSLETSFPFKEFQMWTGGEEAGIFIVIHSGKDNIKRIVIGPGNNP